MNTDMEVAGAMGAQARAEPPGSARPDGTRVRITGDAAAPGAPWTRPGPPATVLVADRLRAVAESLAGYLEAAPRLTAHGVAVAAAELLPLLDTRPPHLLVLDSALLGPPAPGPRDAAADASLVASVRLRHPDTRILMIGPAGDAAAVATALRDGALGWVTVDAPAAHLVEAAHGVLHGQYRIAPALLAAALGAGTGGRPDGRPDATRANERSYSGAAPGARDAALARLSARERLVLCCLVGGMNRREIAARLGIAETTARTHIGRILIKLDAHSMVEAAAVGRRAGLSAVEL